MLFLMETYGKRSKKTRSAVLEISERKEKRLSVPAKSP